MASTVFQKPITDSVAKINQELAVGEDLEFQRRWWRFERGIWILFVAIIVLDLVGAFGRGPLANATAHSPTHVLEITYERIQRAGTPSMMTVRLNPQAQSDDVELFLSDSAVSDLGLRRVIPAPLTTAISKTGLTYRFPRGSVPATVRFEFEPDGFGVYRIALKAPGDQPVELTVAVVP